MNVKTRTWTKKTVQRSKRMTIPDRDRKKAIIYLKGYPFRIWVGIALHRGPQVGLYHIPTYPINCWPFIGAGPMSLHF